jgi:DHA1 family inner membrane transport protein
MRLPLFALAIASFGIGTTEFVIMGLLPDVARDLGVTIPTAGLLVTGYALGVTVGGPILAIATGKMERRRALLGLIALFIIGNVLCAVAPGYWLLMAARIVTAFCHGAFFGLGAVVAADIVPPKQRTQAIAIMFAGLTLANVLGVPFGTAFGQAFGWRATFWAVAGIGVVAALALVLWLPRGIQPTGDGLLHEMRTLKRPQVLLAMLISVLASASLFSVFTYITPILEQVTGVQPSAVTWILLIFGVGLTLGNFAGGWLGDRRPMPTVIGIFAALVVVLVLFSVTARSLGPAVVTLLVWGIMVFALVSPLQMRVLNEAVGAPNLASTINQGAFNLGNASGAWIGGAALTYGVPYGSLSWIGAVLALAGLGCTVYSHALDRRGRVDDCGKIPAPSN